MAEQLTDRYRACKNTCRSSINTSGRIEYNANGFIFARLTQLQAEIDALKANQLPPATCAGEIVRFNGTTYAADGKGNINIGCGTSKVNAGLNTIQIGFSPIVQYDTSIAIGDGAGNYQSAGAIAIGTVAGIGQGINSVALGVAAGTTGQGTSAVAVGPYAGSQDQANLAVAVGESAGANSQGLQATAIGDNAGAEVQATLAVALGSQAGQYEQGAAAVAIGALAGNANQAANSIVINATGVALENTTTDTCVVKPIRTSGVGPPGAGYGTLAYHIASGEIVYYT